jgi:hypothetical protein
VSVPRSRQSGSRAATTNAGPRWLSRFPCLLRSLPRLRPGFALRPASAQADGAAATTSLTPSSGHSGDANATARCRSARYSGVVPVGDLGGKPCVIQLVTTRPAAALWQTEYPPARTEACEKCRQWRRRSLDCADHHAKARSYSRDRKFEEIKTGGGLGIYHASAGLSGRPGISDVKAGARSMGLRIEVFNASTESEIDTAFAALSARRLGALLMANHPLFTTRRERIIALAARYAVPTMYVEREFASAGGLITYGTDLPEVYRLTGGYAGRILRGDKPADLSVLLPTKFELVIRAQRRGSALSIQPASLDERTRRPGSRSVLSGVWLAHHKHRCRVSARDRIATQQR